MNKFKIEKVIEIIKNDNSLRRFFWDQISKTTNPIIWLRPLKEENFFSPEKNPAPIEANEKGYFTIPNWEVLGFLENVAFHISKNENSLNENLDILISIINSLMEYRNSDNERTDNYKTDASIVKILSFVPVGKITSNHLNFVKESLNARWSHVLNQKEIGNTLLPHLLENNAKDLSLELLETVFMFKKESELHFDSILENYWLEETINQNIEQIKVVCGFETVELIFKIMKKKIELHNSSFSLSSINSIDEVNHKNKNKEYETLLIFSLLEISKAIKSKRMKTKIRELLNEEHSIFNRIAIYLIDKNFNAFGEVFWDYPNNLLEKILARYEIVSLIENNFKSLSHENISQYLCWVKGVKYYSNSKKKIESQSLVLYQKQLIEPLKEIGNVELQKFYEKLYLENTSIVEPNKPLIQFESSIGGEVSPISSTELSKKSNFEIVKFLNDFKEEGSWRSPSILGLHEVFRECVRKNPLIFFEKIDLFLKLKINYLSALLRGFSEALTDKKEIEWKILFEFMLKIFQHENFWEQEDEIDKYPYKSILISSVSELIENGSKNDQSAFDIILLPKAENIILILLENTKSDMNNDYSLLNSFVNSTRGKVFEALIAFALRCRRIKYSKKKVKWNKRIKKVINDRLDRKIDSSVEYSIFLGMYLHNLLYLDSDWVNQNFKRIFPLEKPEHFKASLTGYLGFANVHQEIFQKFDKHNYYLEALKIEFDEEIKTRLIQHICIGFWYEWDKLNSSHNLIDELIKRKNPNELQEVLNFFFRSRSNEKFINDKKLKKLIGKIFPILEENENSLEFKKLISFLSHSLLNFVLINEEIIKWVKFSNKYLNEGFNSPFFVEGMLKHVEKFPDLISELYIATLELGHFPEYKKEHIQEIIKVLFKKGKDVEAKRICNLYFMKGNPYILKEIYQQNTIKE